MSAAWWYANRAAGLVAWALLAGSMVLGLMLSTKVSPAVAGKKARPNWIQDLHRGLSGLSLAFVGVHVAAAIGDNYIHFGAADVLVPGASSWRPLAIAAGIVAMYLLVAVEVSSLLRSRIPKSVWRKIHFLTFPLFLTATGHAIAAGSEMGTTAGIAVATLVTAGIVALTAKRITDELEKAKHPPAPRIPARPAATTLPASPVLPFGTLVPSHAPVDPAGTAGSPVPPLQPVGAPIQPRTIGAQPVAQPAPRNPFADLWAPTAPPVPADPAREPHHAGSGQAF